MLKKFLLKPGVNRENTRYTTEGGWYSSDKVRFRQGTPEKIGGWERISANTFIGLCRSLFAWTTLAGRTLIGTLTERRSYIAYNGQYNNITPISFNNGYSYPVTVYSATAGSSTIRLSISPSWSNAADFTWVGGYVYLYGTTGLDATITSSVLNNKFFTITAFDSTNNIIDIDVGVNATSNASMASIAGLYSHSEPVFSNYRLS